MVLDGKPQPALEAMREDFPFLAEATEASLLTQESGGSGTFFYVVAALNTADGYLAIASRHRRQNSVRIHATRMSSS